MGKGDIVHVGQLNKSPWAAWMRLALTAMLVCGVALLVAALWPGAGGRALAAQAPAEGMPTPPNWASPVLGTRTPTPPAPGKGGLSDAEPTGSPAPDGAFAGWERPALRDLAEVVGWPTVVAYDSSGRLKVESVTNAGEWEAAHIRAFDYPAGASASFQAEQDDSRLEGFAVSQEEFFSYPAYSAMQTDSAGVVVERRLRWLSETWIVGVDVRGSAAASPATTRLIAEQLLSIAVWRGLPGPPSGYAPTPNPTWGLPPNPTATGTPCPIVFSDVAPDYWASGYIYSLACAHIVSGYSDGTFRPEYPTTRAQLAKMLVLAQGWTLANPQTASFQDVGLSHPFFRFVETAAEHRVISGYGDGTFRPDAFVTRAQVAKMFVRAQGWTVDPSSPVELRDVTPEHWAWSYIEAALQHGLFSGYSDNNFRPSMLATRGQLAKLLALTLPH